MAKTFHLTIARVGETVFDGEALSVHLPGAEGGFTVLAHHEAFVSELKEGEAKVETAEGEKRTVPIAHGGIAEVSGNQATVLL
ncbi:F0F1 ATP synthase subunit epsilon [Candidatus Parcubacteria bacterium]|nr:F0F1 ATP synthase subunit epsilon [Candidatus Parcubacteria bacterium]